MCVCVCYVSLFVYFGVRCIKDGFVGCNNKVIRTVTTAIVIAILTAVVIMIFISSAIASIRLPIATVQIQSAITAATEADNFRRVSCLRAAPASICTFQAKTQNRFALHTTHPSPDTR